MAWELSTQCNFIFGILSCTHPEDTIDVDLKVHTLWRIHTYKKGKGTQVIKCSPWGTEVQPFLSLKKKIAEFMKHRHIVATPFANRSFQPRPKVAARKHNLVPLIKLSRKKLSQPMKINVRHPPEAISGIGQLLLEKPKMWEVQQPAWPHHRPANQWAHHPHCLLLHQYHL